MCGYYGLTAKTVKVGIAEKYTMPSQVVSIVVDGDTVEIAPGVYVGETAVWRQHNLTLRSPQAFAHLQAPNKLAEDKAIWVIKGNNVKVENIEFSGAQVQDRNGAGIRMEGLNLTVVGCYFHHNQDGILTFNDPGAVLTITRSEFGFNGAGDGLSHNLYVGRIAKLRLEQSYLHEANVGHLLKCRARTTEVYYNYFSDSENGNSSYVLNFPNGGQIWTVGNVLIKGPQAENKHVIAFGEEGNLHENTKLHLVHNTLISRRRTPLIFLFMPVSLPVDALNNLFTGLSEPLASVFLGEGNLYIPVESEVKFKDALKHDFRLLSDSPALDAGMINDSVARPFVEYRHPLQTDQREDAGLPDAGACGRFFTTSLDQNDLLLLDSHTHHCLYTLTGVLLFRGDEDEFFIKLKHLPAGIYLHQVSNNDHITFTQKLWISP